MSIHLTATPIGIVYGALGGLLRHLVVQHGIVLPKKRKGRIELGMFQGIILGSGAGLVVVAGDHISPIVLAVIGGFAGAGLLASKALDLFGRIVYNIDNAIDTNNEGLNQILGEDTHGDHDDDGTP